MKIVVVVLVALAAPEAMGSRVKRVQTDWEKYQDATDNGVEAILAVKDTTEDKEDTLKALASVVQVAVPFIPPPAGMVVGGSLSLMSGILGWENDGMAALSDQIEAGFAKITVELASISKKLDDMAAAIDLIGTRTLQILSEIQDLRHVIDTATINDVRAEYKVLINRMRAMKIHPDERETEMADLIFESIKPRAAQLEVMIEANFTSSKVRQIVYGRYNRDGNTGKCKARDLLEHITAARFEGYILLYLSAIKTEKGGISRTKAEAHTTALTRDITAYSELRKEIQNSDTIPWDWAGSSENSRAVACPGGAVRQIDQDYRYPAEAHTLCAGNGKCVGVVTQMETIFRWEPIVRKWVPAGTEFLSTYYGKGTCFSSDSTEACALFSFNRGVVCHQSRAKNYRECWTH